MQKYKFFCHLCKDIVILMKKVLFVLTLLLGLFSVNAGAKNPPVKVDDRLPAGNIVFERIIGDTVYVKPDLSGNHKEWFYWAMRVRGAQGRTLVFQFPKKWVGARGAVVSLDKGKTFFYSNGKAGKSFTWTFGPNDHEVYFYECHPYLPADWERFLGALNKDYFRTSVLCRSRSGKKVPMATFGCLGENPKYRMVLTARHHCSESVASYVMEGILQACCADDQVGRWFRDNVEVSVVPFVDYDGVVNGDQGKFRAPHDHNRDYDLFLYPETKAVSELYARKLPQVIMDLHDPWISGPTEERMSCPMSNPEIVPDNAAEAVFTTLMEQYAKGLPYKGSNNVEFGTRWNTNKNYSDGQSCRIWAMLHLPAGTIHLCRCFEIPFANAEGVEVNPDSCREFGRSITETLVHWFGQVKP